MAHFAKLDKNNTVIEVIVVSNNDTLDEYGNESEEIGIEFCRMLHGPDTMWKQTSYNGNFRGILAGIGMIYDEENDIFVDVNAPLTEIYNPPTLPERRFFEHL
jgi:hypothetical protein